MDYAGTSISINIVENETSKQIKDGPDLVYVHKCENGRTDAKVAFIEAMTKFAESEEFTHLTHNLYSNFELTISHCVHTAMPGA